MERCTDFGRQDLDSATKGFFSWGFSFILFGLSSALLKFDQIGWSTWGVFALVSVCIIAIQEKEDGAEDSASPQRTKNHQV